MYLYQGAGYDRILEITGIKSEMDRVCSTEIFQMDIKVHVKNCEGKE
jgi:hypothetical protein